MKPARIEPGFMLACAYLGTLISRCQSIQQGWRFQAWRLDWRKPSKDGSTSWEDLVMQAVMRRSEQQAA
jgi:hypothetical protein